MGVTDIPNPGLYTDLYQLTMSQGYYKTGLHRKKAYFDYFFRNAPFGGEFVVFAGLADLLSVLDNFRFTGDERQWLEQKKFDKDFCDYLENYRFDGTIMSVREGEVVFPGEPVLTVSGSLISCQLVETLLLNILNFQSLIATKARRLQLACGDSKLVDFGLRRAHGAGSISASRAAFIGGADATSNVLAGYRYNIPVSGTMAHSWIQCFETELEAFRRYAHIYPDSCILLVDTYDSVQSGIPNAITVAKELEKEGHRLVGIRLDSGDPRTLTRKARSMLDDAGLSYVAIAISDQLDEDRIVSLIHEGAPVDLFGVGTRLVTGYPDGALSGVYKMCSLDNRPTMKYTEESNKSSLPGVKEIVRESDREGMFRKDLIVLEESGENVPENPPNETKVGIGSSNSKYIRHCAMESGRIAEHETDLHKIAAFGRSRIDRLPGKIKRLSDPYCYDIEMNKSLHALIDKLKR